MIEPMRVAASLAIAGAVYLGLCVFMYATQRAQMYFPTPESDHDRAEAVWVVSDGARLKIWRVLRPSPRALVYFGGNAEDVALNIDAFAAAFPDYSLFLVHYRGYGGSEGRPSERALHADALEVYDYVRAQRPEIAVMGRSLGTGVAMHVAAERRVERVVLVSPYDSLVNVARSHFPYLPVRWLMLDRYEALRDVPMVRAPVLAIIAERDSIIRRERSEALISVFPAGQVEVRVIAEAGHNTLDLYAEYLAAVRAFLG